MIEVCVDSVESALAAERGGADRLELCSALIIGGLSPSVPLVKAIRRRMTLPMRAMVRPRFGDFLYSSAEQEVMIEEAWTWAELGLSGIVCGALLSDGRLDVDFLRTLIAHSPGVGHTLHRAFDVCRDPFEALETAIALGFDTILTSGQQASCAQGTDLIRDLRVRAAGRIEILVGAGVSASIIPQLKKTTGCTAFHLSGKVTHESGMVFRRSGVPMGLPGFDEFTRWQTDEKKISAAAKSAKIK